MINIVRGSIARLSFFGVAVLFGGSAGLSLPVRAQSSGGNGVNGAGSANGANITTDTGDFALDRTSLEHYTTPQLCIAAVRNTARHERRDIAGQLAALQLRQTPLVDTLPSRAVAVAKRCLGRFSVAAIAVRDLPDVLTLSLMANQDTMAQAVVARWLSLAPTAARRDTVQSMIMEMYLSANPARADAAEAMADRPAETGVPATRWRAQAAVAMLNFWSEVYQYDKIRQWAERVIATVNSLPASRVTDLQWAHVRAYMAISQLMYVQHPDSIPVIAQRARNDWSKFALDSLSPLHWDPRSVSADTLQEYLSPFRGQAIRAGAQYPALAADYWFPARPATNRDSAVTLVVSTHANWYGSGSTYYSGPGCLSGEIEMLYDPFGHCTPLYEKIRQIVGQYGERGLRVVLVTGTQGDVVRSLPLDPAKEADRLRWYFLDYLKLPVTLAVVQRPFVQLPQPDGRRWTKSVCGNGGSLAVDSSTIACRYLAVPFVLLGKRHELLYAGSPEPLFDVILDHAMNRPVASSGNSNE